MKSKRNVRIQLGVSESVKEIIFLEAEKRGVSVSSMLSEVVINEFIYNDNLEEETEVEEKQDENCFDTEIFDIIDPPENIFFIKITDTVYTNKLNSDVESKVSYFHQEIEDNENTSAIKLIVAFIILVFIFWGLIHLIFKIF